MELVSAPNPHFIPGYTGFCPQYKYRIGDTYGTTTHKVLLDPTVHHAEKLVLSDRLADDYQVVRPPQKDIDIVNARAVTNDTIYKHPIIPGYEGFVPREHNLMGQRFTVQATEALSEFEKLQSADKTALNELLRIGAVQDAKWYPNTLSDRELTSTQFKLPLTDVRPECAGILRNLPQVEPPLTPPRHSPSPYFMDNIDPEKYFKKGLSFVKMYEKLYNSFIQNQRYGFAGHVPFGYGAFGKVNEAMTNSALCDFTSNYRKRLSTEWAPVTISRADPPLLIQPSEIYHKHIGQLPNYGGHIPGAIFRFGKTYGNDSRDAKRWLRGDYS